jgi:hypothetical protein
LAVEAVISEPVSGRTFPVTRENTGKFIDLGLEMPKALGFRREIQLLTIRIP